MENSFLHASFYFIFFIFVFKLYFLFLFTFLFILFFLKNNALILEEYKEVRRVKITCNIELSEVEIQDEVIAGFQT